MLPPRRPPGWARGLLSVGLHGASDPRRLFYRNECDRPGITAPSGQDVGFPQLPALGITWAHLSHLTWASGLSQGQPRAPQPALPGGWYRPRSCTRAVQAAKMVAGHSDSPRGPRASDSCCKRLQLRTLRKTRIFVPTKEANHPPPRDQTNGQGTHLRISRCIGNSGHKGFLPHKNPSPENLLLIKSRNLNLSLQVPARLRVNSGLRETAPPGNV